MYKCEIILVPVNLNSLPIYFFLYRCGNFTCVLIPMYM